MTTISGGCLCGRIRYQAEGEPLLALWCHCRDCQYVSGGKPALHIWTVSAQPWHHVEPSAPQFAKNVMR